MKAFKAGIRIYGFHLSVVLFSIFLVIPFFTVVQKWPYIFSGFTFLLYLLILYPLGWNYGFKDSRKIPGFYPDKKFAVQAAGVGMIIPFVLFLVRIIFPDIWHIPLPLANGETDFFISGVKVYGTTDMIFKIWFFPMCAFLTNSNLFVYFLWVLFQPAMFVLSYFMGLKRISIKGIFISKFVYKKDKKK